MSLPGRMRETLALTALSLVVAGSLATSAWALPDFDGDGALPPQDCNPMDAAVAPGKPDVPDLAFEDTNCDGVDGDAGGAVFVALGGSNAGTGSKENPLLTINAAIAKAKAEGKDVYIAGGTYAESVNLEDGVGLFGGYAPITGARSADEVTVIAGVRQAALADGDTGVILQRLTLRATAPAAESAYGLRAINNSAVALVGVTTEPGPGSTGATGDSPARPTTPSSFDGSAGQSPCTRGARNTVNTPGVRGVGAGGRDGGSGGPGGATNGARGADGDDGVPNGNSGGDGMTGFGEAGSFGVTGAAGGNGANGAFGLGSAGPLWAAPAGALGGVGSDGGRGSGGGGGGGGGGGQGTASVGSTTIAFAIAGGGGGGGGGGGEGGPRGGSGSAAGGSFGVYLHNAKVVATSSVIKAANGGTGGNGGVGALGAPGGSGAPGGPGASCATRISVPVAGDVTVGVAARGGGAGGRGGDGGKGGNGGGGAGGPSAAVFRVGAGAAYASRTTVEQAGAPGPGGRVGGNGAQAAAGQAAAQLAAPGAGNTPGDFDGDGQSDATDSCPDVAAIGGCPERPAALADADGDQIPDGSDACPAIARGIDLDENGCPDPAPRPPTGLDADGDGFFAGQDCNDGNPAIRPGAQEILGNRIDENCDGRADPFRAITSAVSSRWSVRGARVRLTLLRARNVPARASGLIRCTGAKCPFKRTRVAVRKRTIDFRKALSRRERKLRAGQTIEVRVTAPQRIGKVVRFKLKPRKIPRGETLCLPAGGSRPQRRCS